MRKDRNVFRIIQIIHYVSVVDKRQTFCSVNIWTDLFTNVTGDKIGFF